MVKNQGLHSLELKALSVPSSLRFLLGVEYDVVLCITEIGSRRSCTIKFPLLANTFQKLLEMCAQRFGLESAHYDDHSLLSGTAIMPPLRYVDYLPGALNAEEILACLGVSPPSKPQRCGDSVNEFIASFIDYNEYNSDASLSDVHGAGFYLTLDYGLSSATHSHLVEIRFHGGCSVEEALKEFEEFSGWNSFDLRYNDENDKSLGGIIVMPSTQDACDLFEKYEDEDSDDDEGTLLPFMLRPVAPLVPVPSVEDSALKKLRDQHWGEIEKFWERFPRWRNCVVVSNLYDSASLEETLAFFEGLTITASSLVEDKSPARRRRVFVTFATSDEAKKALLLDGRSTKGKTLRVQVSPPYLDESRRGRVVVGPLSTSLTDSLTQQSQEQGKGIIETDGRSLVSSSTPIQDKRDTTLRSGGLEAPAVPASSSTKKENTKKREMDDKKWNTPVVSYNSKPNIISGAASAPSSSPSTTAAIIHSTGAEDTPASPIPAPTTTSHTPSLTGSTMNANAREFIPAASSPYHIATSPEFYPIPARMSYMEECLTSLPPPAYAPVPLTPAGLLRPMGGGGATASQRSPHLGVTLPPPPPPPPPYNAPPPYSIAAAQAVPLSPQPPMQSPPM